MPRRSAEAELMPRVDGQPELVRPRAGLDAEVRRVFEAMASAVSPGHFRPGDLPLLEAFCETVALGRQAAAALRREGVVDELGKPSPWLAVLDRCNRSLVPMAKSLRLAPSTRTDPKTVARSQAGFDAEALLRSFDTMEAEAHAD